MRLLLSVLSTTVLFCGCNFVSVGIIGIGARGAGRVSTNSIYNYYLYSGGAAGIVGYRINMSTGALTATPNSPYASDSFPSLVPSPSGSFLFGAFETVVNNVTVRTIAQTTGEISEIVTSPYSAGNTAVDVAVHPTKNFLYVTNTGSNDISAYTYNSATGALAAVAGSPFATGASPWGLKIDPTGKFLYTANSASHNISGFTINQTTGALAAIGGSPWASGDMAGSTPFEVAIDSTGTYLYSTNNFESSLTHYTINATTGVLAKVGVSVATGISPLGINIDPQNQYIYVTNSGADTVTVYSINSLTGVPTVTPGSPYATGDTGASRSMIDPSGTFLYVTNITGPSLTGFRISSGGVLTMLPGFPLNLGAISPWNIAITRVLQ